jgi:hypothetical protein
LASDSLEALNGEDLMSDHQREAELEADAAKNNQLKTPVEARQGVKTRHIRWVLAISLTLGVVAMIGAYMHEVKPSHATPGGMTSVPSGNG